MLNAIDFYEAILLRVFLVRTIVPRLLKDWETFNSFRTPSNIYEGTFCKLSAIASNVKLKQLIILTNGIDVWLRPECGSGHNIVLKIQSNISPWKQVKVALFYATLSIWNLGHLIV